MALKNQIIKDLSQIRGGEYSDNGLENGLNGSINGNIGGTDYGNGTSDADRQKLDSILNLIR